jgi:hypothetical protein
MGMRLAELKAAMRRQHGKTHQNHLRRHARTRRSRHPDLFRRPPRCSHSIAISGDSWPDDVRLSTSKIGSSARASGKRGADVPPDFNFDKKPVRIMGYR